MQLKGIIISYDDQDSGCRRCCVATMHSSICLGHLGAMFRICSGVEVCYFSSYLSRLGFDFLLGCIIWSGDSGCQGQCASGGGWVYVQNSVCCGRLSLRQLADLLTRQDPVCIKRNCLNPLVPAAEKLHDSSNMFYHNYFLFLLLSGRPRCGIMPRPGLEEFGSNVVGQDPDKPLSFFARASHRSWKNTRSCDGDAAQSFRDTQAPSSLMCYV